MEHVLSCPKFTKQAEQRLSYNKGSINQSTSYQGGFYSEENTVAHAHTDTQIHTHAHTRTHTHTLAILFNRSQAPTYMDLQGLYVINIILFI